MQKKKRAERVDDLSLYTRPDEFFTLYFLSHILMSYFFHKRYAFICKHIFSKEIEPDPKYN